MPSTNIAQRFYPTEQRLTRALDTKYFKQQFLNHWSKFKIVSQKCFFHNALYQHLTNGSAQPNKWATRVLDKKCLYMTSPLEPLVQIQTYFTEIFLIMPSTKIEQMVLLHKTRGPLELDIRNHFKGYLLNHWSQFKIIS